MKLIYSKILFLILLVAASMSMTAQTIFTQNFDAAWTLPGTLSPAWSGTSTPADNVWHQNAYTTGWTSASGAYSPVAANSSAGSARFHAYDIAAGGTGELISPTIDLSTYTAGTIALDFYHINTSGTDVLNVYSSNDNGATWSAALAPASIGVSAVWTLKTIYLPGNSSTTKIKFTATSDYGTTDIGIDEITVRVAVVANAAPTMFTATAVTQTGMTIGWTDNSTNETKFRVYRSLDNITFAQQGADITSTSTATTGTTYSQAQTSLMPGTTYYYRIVAVVEVESSYLTGSQATLPAGTITSVASGNWSAPATWSTGAVPTATDNVQIADGHTVNIDITAPACLNLTVGQGVSGTLTFTSAAASTLTVNGSVTVATGGNFNAGTTATIVHIIYIGGNSATAPYASNLTVNGNFDMWATATTGRATITFFGVQNSVISGAGTIDFNSTNILNKGATTATSTTTPPILDLQKAFTVLGANVSGFITTLTAGTLKISGSFTQSNPVFTAVSYSIPATGGIWLSNANFTIAGLTGGPTVTGLFRVTAGTYNIGTAAGNTLGSGTGSVYIIEGGAINVSGRFSLTSAGVYYNQSGGTLTVPTVGNTSTTVASFGITSSTSTSFIMSGGSIVLVQKSSGTGTTARDYYVVANPTITGGTLQIGTAATATNFNFRLYGYAPSIVIDNTTNPKKVEVYQTTGVLYVLGNLTVNTGATFDCLGFTAYVYGNVTNNGIIQGLITGSRFDFSGTTAQTYSGTGTFGTAAAPFIGTGVGIGNTNNVTLNSPIVTTRVNLFAGTFINANQITLGNAGASTGYIQRGGSAGNPAGAFDVSPTFNIGTGGMTVNYTTATTATTSGFELPPSRAINNLVINNAPGVTLSGGGLSTAAMTMTLGNLTTTSSNLVTITGTTAAALTYTAGYVNGPIARTFPASLVTGSTYLFPVGKSAYKPLELVNPLTNAGGTVVVQAEVFDANCGGTPGANMSTLNTDRYWSATISSGAANFTSSTVRLTEAGLSGSSGMGRSTTLTGAYNLSNSSAAGATTIISDVQTGLDYFAIGVKSVPMTFASSTTTQASAAAILQNSTNQAVIGVQVVTNDNANPLEITKFTFNANGTTAATDISNAKVWSTGNAATFAATTQFGSTVASPTLTSFDITGSQSLLPGTNYFWLTYDIPLNAIATNVVDAECTNVTVATVDHLPTATAPSGTRTITINAPTAFTATGTSSSQIDLTWTKNSVGQDVMIATNSTNSFGTPANGTLYAAGATLPTAGTIIYNGPLAAFSHTGLTANTAYYYKAWSVDANNYYSATGPTANASTPCAATSSFPYNEGFETGHTDQALVANCWTQEVSGSYSFTANSTLSTYNRAPHAGTWDAYLHYSGNSWLFRKFTLTAGTSYDVSCWARQDGATLADATVEIKYGTTGTSAGMANTIVASTGLNATYAQLIGSFTPATTGDYYIGFHGVINGNPWYITLDDIKVDLTPSCPAPTVLTAGTITSASASLGWTSAASTFDIEYGPAGFTQGTGTTVTGVSNPYALSGLTPNTNYGFYVKSNCPGPIQSSWAGPKTFVTLCASVSTINENFDAVTAPALPGCWAKYVSPSWGSQTVTTYATSPNSSPNSIQLYSSGASLAADAPLLISPVVSNVASNSQLKFFAKGASTNTSIIIGTMSDPTNPATFTTFQTVTGLSTTGWNEYVVSFATYSGSDQYIAFKHPLTTTYSYVYVDNVVWEAIPACPSPTLLTIGGITTISADLSWTSSASTFDIEYGPAGFTQGTGTTITGVSNPYTLSGLTENTNYGFYVRANCAGPTQSTWGGPKTFVTLCNPTSSFPYNEGFETGHTDQAIVSNCWSQEIVGSYSFMANSSLSTYNRAPHTGTWDAYLHYSGDAWLFRKFALTGGTTYDVSCWARQDMSTLTDATFEIKYGTTNTSAGMTNTVVASTGLNTTYAQMSGTLTPATSGDYYIGFHGIMNSTPYYISLDDIYVNASGAPIPVKMEYFRGSKQGNSHTLDWKVSSTNTQFVNFSLETSNDGIRFHTLYTAKETALRCLSPFNFVNSNPVSGINYYRLKMTDDNGVTTYSSVVALLSASKGFEIINITPNPVTNGQFKLNISAAEQGKMDIVITDMAGRIVAQQNANLISGFNAIDMKVGNLSAGTYQIYGSSANGKTKVLHLVKQ